MSEIRFQAEISPDKKETADKENDAVMKNLAREVRLCEINGLNPQSTYKGIS